MASVFLLLFDYLYCGWRLLLYLAFSSSYRDSSGLPAFGIFSQLYFRFSSVLRLRLILFWVRVGLAEGRRDVVWVSIGMLVAFR
jgi:hypothetical protein